MNTHLEVVPFLLRYFDERNRTCGGDEAQNKQKIHDESLREKHETKELESTE
jgi:hypothetical protein